MTDADPAPTETVARMIVLCRNGEAGKWSVLSGPMAQTVVILNEIVCRPDRLDWVDVERLVLRAHAIGLDVLLAALPPLA